MKALVIGGTGPTGPYVVEGLLKKGYQVTILHRGTHEVELPGEVEHLHGDPHFAETLEQTLGGRTFDVVVGMYGRLREVAKAMKGRTPRFIAIGGMAVYRGWGLSVAAWNQEGVLFPTPEDAPLQTDPELDKFTYLMVLSEQAVMEAHHQGHYQATLFRYPMVYGPRQLAPREWSLIRRILDGRKQLLLPDGGLPLLSRGYAENMAHAVLLALEQPRSAGQIYNVADEKVLSVREWVELIAREMGHLLELIEIPYALARPARSYSGRSGHRVLDLRKIKEELSYRDLVPAEEAIRRTVRWYLEHRPEPGGEEERQLTDTFDYPAEDQIIREFRQSGERIRQVEFVRPQWRHPYPHPKAPGEKAD